MNITLALILLIILLFVWEYFRWTKINYDGNEWHMAEGYKNKIDAAKLLSNANNKVLILMKILQKKYRIDETDDLHDAAYYALRKHPGDLYNIVGSMISGYNPEVFYENDPRFSSDTSYTIRKGERMYICLRNRNNPNSLVDLNTLIFVILHEACHIGNYNGIDHQRVFWRVFKFILHEAVLAGIYHPIDYEKHPVIYCGLAVTYQPLYDNTLENIWQ